MAEKERLRQNRAGTIINVTSKKMEQDVIVALQQTVMYIEKKFRVRLAHTTDLFLKDIISVLQERYQDVDFTCKFERSSMRPDGGILSIVAKDSRKFPILITEAKNQGTNELRPKEGKPKQAKGNAIERLGKNVIGFRTVLLGKPKQAKGNAIERLGKNVIGFRTVLLHESIFPFVCFGDGCDFAPDSSILDRVITISMFGELNKIRVHNEGPNGIFNRGSFYFRERKWTAGEMQKIMSEVAAKSIYYYFSKYGENTFRNND